MKLIKLSLLAATVVTISTGCAVVGLAATGPSNTAAGSTIEKNTARTLGLDVSALTLSNVEGSYLKTTYTAKTNTGKTYGCYVTGASIMTSDAVCTEVNGGSGSAPAPVCNALLKAAGRCN
jgi:hypothetical protein